MVDNTPSPPIDLSCGEYDGVRVIEDDFGHVRSVYGHVSADTFASAVQAHERAVYGQVFTVGLSAIEHVWAVLEHGVTTPEDEGWHLTWDRVTPDTEGAFPMTVGPAL